MREKLVLTKLKTLTVGMYDVLFIFYWRMRLSIETQRTEIDRAKPTATIKRRQKN